MAQGVRGRCLIWTKVQLTFVVLLGAMACARDPSATAQAAQAPAGGAGQAIVLQDDLGRTVRLRAPAQRIVSLSPAMTEILYAVGCGDRLVLRDGWSDFPPVARKVPAIEGFAPSPEAILATQPDLVVSHFPPPGLRTALDAAGIAWLGYAPATLPAVAASFASIGQACGQPAAGANLRAAFQQRLAEVRARVAQRPAPRVFYEMDAGGGRPFTISRKSFGHEVLQAAGGTNVFADAEAPWFQVSTESVLTADPDFILLADAGAIDQPQSAEAVAARPGWATLRAVRERRVVPLQIDWVSRPGPRLILGIEQIAHTLHPQAFVAVPVRQAPLPVP